MLSRTLAITVSCCLLAAAVRADEHRVEVLTEGPPQDALSEEILQAVASSGFKVVSGASRTVCEIWPCRQWPVQAGFEATPNRLYPFEPGQLMGVLRFPRRSSEFRDQTIQRGVYTLRFGLQPVDGNHVGTSPTRDFLVLVRADEDKTAANWDFKELLEASARAAESSHPAMLCLQSAVDSPTEPAMRHNEEQDWWILDFVGQGVSEGKSKPLTVALVVAGHASE